MKNFNLELFNLALNFDRNNHNQSTPGTILTSMGFTQLESRRITNKLGNIIRVEYLLTNGYIVSVKRLSKGKQKATVKPAFPTKPSKEKVEDIFGEGWVSIDSVESHVGGLAEGSVLKLRNGDKITAKSFLVNYSIPEIGQVQTGVFDTTDKFHSIEEVIAVWC